MELSNIQQRGKALLVDITAHGKRHRVTCATMEEALKVRDKIMRIGDNEALAPVKSNGWTLQQAFDATANVCWKGLASEANSIRNGQEAIAYFGAETPLKEVVQQDWIDGYLVRLKDSGSSNATINRKMASLSRIISYAIECKRLSADDRPVIRRQKEMECRMRIITPVEEKRILAYLSQWGKDDHAEVVCVLIDSGLRPSELFRVEARDCDFTKGKFGAMEIVFTKNGKKRTVPMTQRVSEIMKRRIEVTVSGPVFPFDKDWLIRAWLRVRSVMGLDADKEFIPYAMRHTCATRLIQRGVHLRVVQEWLGHESIRITQKYAKVLPDDLFGAAAVLEAV